MRAAFLVMAMAAAAPAWAGEQGSADQAYEAAREGYFALKADPELRKFRHHWHNAARKFDQVAARFPRSPKACDASYTAGELRWDLSRFSKESEDVDGAIVAYRRVAEDCPKHRLADDAALALGRIYAGQGDAAKARKVIEDALAFSPKGDKAPKLKELLASLTADAPAAPAKLEASEPKDVKPEPAARRSKRAKTAVVEAPKAEAPKPEPAADAGPSDALKSALAKVSAAARVVPSVLPEPKKPLVAPAAKRPPSRLGDEAELALSASGHGEVDTALPRMALPTLADVQKRLRDVRVGPQPEAVDDKTARARLKQVASAAKRGAGEITLAEQLGLKYRRVVIDAGHGGHDTGAIGPSGIQEKDVALSIAGKLAALLNEAGLEVLLTRDDDTFVRLEERARLANEAKGDLFISIHCNSAPSNKLRGIETYTLNTASDRYSVRLAARENAHSETSVSNLQFILADLATKANTEESSRLANVVQRSLTTSLRAGYKDVRDLGHKEALFYVLLGTRMPAILVETSFLSNPEEEKRLGSAEYQDDVAAAIAAGVKEFVGDRERLAKID